jgi:hypothetical protein
MSPTPLFLFSARLLSCLALGITLPFAAIQAAEEVFPGVEKLMSDTEFTAAGLDSLSPAQLESLNTWLVRYTAGEAEVLQQTNEAVREAEKELEIVARLDEDFEGWEGKTLFRLDNGQIWKQRNDGRYRYRGPAKPGVRIDKNWLGFYKMTLIDEDRSIGVTRVR